MVGMRLHLEANDGTGYVSALKWLRRVLYLTKLSPADVKMAAQRLASEIPAQVAYIYSSTCIHIYTYATCNPKPSLVYYVSTYIHIYTHIACDRELSLAGQCVHTVI